MLRPVSRVTPLAVAAVLSLTVSSAAADMRWRPKPPQPCIGALPPGTPLSCLGTAPIPARSNTVAYEGLGTWLDAYDWAPEYGGTVKPSALDEMQRRGIRTIYIQAAKQGTRSKGTLLSPSLLGQWLVGAHARGIRVQAWYLPLFTDVAKDNASLDAIVAFRSQGHAFDTIGMDIEWRGVTDVKVRNSRLVAMSKRLRDKVPHLPLAAIVVAPVVTNDVNKNFWNPFPWAELKPLYDVWQPMGYWTDRTSTSKWRDAHTSTVWNVRYLREDLGDPKAKVHSIGGISPTGAEVRGFVNAANEESSLGGSIYDYPHTAASVYKDLQKVPNQG